MTVCGLPARRPVVVPFGLVLCVGLLACGRARADEQPSLPETPYGVGKWDEPLGNHRARVAVDAAAPAVRASLQWRRSDLDVEKKDVIVVDARTGKPVANRVVAEINRERGEVVFQASRTWQELARVPRSSLPGEPAAVRLGKMSLGLKAEDHSPIGPGGRCEIKDLRVFGGSPRR